MRERSSGWCEYVRRGAQSLGLLACSRLRRRCRLLVLPGDEGMITMIKTVLLVKWVWFVSEYMMVVGGAVSRPRFGN